MLVVNMFNKIQKLKRMVPASSFTARVLNFPLQRHQRSCSDTKSDKTLAMVDLLKQRFPQAKNVEVLDVSGGCGAMYEVLVESIEFQGLPVVKQHRLITEALKEQIKGMHGLRIHTIVPR